MNRDEFLSAIRQALPAIEVSADPQNAEAVTAPSANIRELAQWLRDDSASQLTYFDYITALDHPDRNGITVVYSLFSHALGHRLMIKCQLDRTEPRIDSVSDIWEGADWSEREVYDLFGVTFAGHPDLRRIMMYEGWEGYPLRKDYTHPNLIHRPD